MLWDNWWPRDICVNKYSIDYEALERETDEEGKVAINRPKTERKNPKLVPYLRAAVDFRETVFQKRPEIKICLADVSMQPCSLHFSNKR